MVKHTITISSCLEVAVVALFYQAKKYTLRTENVNRYILLENLRFPYVNITQINFW